MSKKLFITSSVVFFFFAIPPLVFSMYKGNLTDSLIIGIILIGILSITTFGYIKNTNKK
ncbi:hypothetical protein ABFG93_22825 (plasmid) [Pseudalkalibacillus hwajinpoensis]|uniref:hypothetical protein n=1 Tax=Guptibacillus hwajinpoensis TaxID=208199 RepID=UPI00325AA2B1